jgi:HAD superfamily hydrolase (TIGR01509 family)
VFARAQAVLFDMGGTLLDYPVPPWPVIAGRCVKGAVSGLVLGNDSSLPPAAAVPDPAHAPSKRASDPDAALPYRVTMALRRVVRSVSGLTLPTLGEMCARPLVAEGSIVPGARETLAVLRTRGYRLGLVSNTPWGTPDYLWTGQLERFGLAGFFEVACFSSDVGFRKPDPRIFRAALKALDVPADRAVFVGDEPEADIGGARAAGVRSVWVDRHHRTPPDPPADLAVTRLTALEGHLRGPGEAKTVDTPRPTA